MSRTVYVNASGLPDSDQITTARDQATLGRAIQDRFPREYRYFSTPVFVYRGWAMRNHNKLLGRVQGIDGIKTGYTRDSGFNLVSSIRRGGRHLVAVVLGGTSGGARDARMRGLIEQEIASASTQRTVAKIAESTEVAAVQPKPVIQLPQTPRLARADAMGPITTNSVSEGDASSATDTRAMQAAAPVAAALSPQPKPGSAEPINPVKVKTITVKAGNVQTAMVVPISPAPTASVAPPHFAKSAPAAAAVAVPAPEKPAASAAMYQVASANSVPVTLPRQPHPRGPWVIQVGAFPKEAEAHERLREAQSLAKSMLAKADPFTERVMKGSQELYRARFAGFDEDSAQAACRYFKRNDIACMAIKN
jgi:D-alanyl-D-alanine carboxypeptidase